jgi:hypothetical protein
MTPDTALLDRARSFPVVSCDIFDTAIRRILARPEDLLLAVGARAMAESLITCSPDAFAAYRQAAERQTRLTAEAAGFDEVPIAEIYAYLEAAGVVTDPVRCARLEFEVECAVCRPIETVRDMVAARLSSGKPDGVVFASDTSLPGQWLAELLESCGYPRGCRVFASADLRLSKHTGRLFPALIAALGRSPKQILHIGDNPVSDVVRPQAHGIAVHHLTRPRPRPEESSAWHPVLRLENSRRRTIAAERIAPEPPGPIADGRALAAHAAPLVIGFSLFILAEAARLGTGRIYFIARDGYLPMAFVERLLVRRGDRQSFELCYLEVSRGAFADGKTARAYLEQCGFLRPGPRLIVDLGWRGSIQAALAQVAGLSNIDLKGCYLGLWADALRPEINPSNAAGYLFAFGHPAATAACVREAYVLLELIFSAPHGTVLRYQFDPAGSCRPVHQIEAGQSGDARRAAFAALEAACRETFDALDAILGGAWPTEIDAQSALSSISSLMITPSRADVALVNRIPFIHDADDSELLPAVNPMPLHEWLLGPQRALRRLGNAPWRAGAVRMALPWPVPAMSYDTLQDRANRILRPIDRIPGRLARRK